MAGILDGDLIRQTREQKGWSQRELASAAGVDHSVISRLERGLQEDVKLSVVTAISTVLNISVDQLLGTRQVSVAPIIPEFAAVIEEFAQQPVSIQKYATGMLKGFLNSLTDEGL